MSYPTGTDLKTYAGDFASLELPDAQWDAFALAAATKFETLTSWRPYLSSGASETRVFDGAAGYNLPIDAVQSVTEVKVDTQVIPATAYVLAGRFRSAYLAIEFNDLWFGGRQNVQVTGVYGLVTAIPPDVRNAVLAGGLALALTNSRALTPGDVRKEKALNIEVEYDLTAGRASLDRLKFQFDQAVEAHKRCWI